MARVNSEQEYIFVNEQLTEETGIPAEKWLGRTHKAIGLPDNICENLHAICEKVIATGQSAEFKTLYEGKSGKRHYRFRAIPEANNENEVLTIMLLASDITILEDTLQQLYASQAHYETLFEGMSDAVFVHEVAEDGNMGRFLEVNTAACERLGYTREELLCLMPFDIDYHDPKKEEEVTRIIQQLAEGKNITFEQTHMTREGKPIRVEISARSLQLGCKTAVISIVRDLSERDAAAVQLRESEEMFRQLMDNVPGAFWMTDKDMKSVLYVDPEISHFWSGNPEELITDPKRWREIIHFEDKHICDQVLKDIANGKTVDAEYRIIKPDKSIIWTHVRAFSICNDKGEIIRLAGFLKTSPKNANCARV